MAEKVSTAALLLAVAAAGCGGAPPRSTRVLVMPTGGAAGEETIRDAIERRSDLTPAGLSRLAALAATRDDEDAAAADPELEAQRLLEMADDAFSRFDYVAATSRLNEALALLAPGAILESGRRRIASVHLQLAMVLHVHGEREAAIEEVRACLHLDPDCAPDPALHPPELVAIHAEVRAHDGALAPGTLRVESEPPGATATLDGRRSDDTPLLWSDVPPGRHYVVVTREGYRTEVETVLVISGETTHRRLALRLGPPSVQAAAALRALQTDGRLAETRWRQVALELAPADVLVVLEPGSAGLSLAAFDARGEPVGDPLDDDARERRPVGRWLARVLPPPRAPWYQQWWFWTPVAVALATGLATGVYFGVRTRPIQIRGGDVQRFCAGGPCD